MSFWKTILSATCKPSFCQFVDHFFLFERETSTLMYLSKKTYWPGQHKGNWNAHQENIASLTT